MRVLDKEWVIAQKILIANGEFKEWIGSFAPAKQFLIGELSKRGTPYKAIQLGAGVMKITTDVTVCPKCKGTGKC